MKSPRELATALIDRIMIENPWVRTNAIDLVTAAIADRDAEHQETPPATRAAIGLLAHEVAAYGHHDADCDCDTCEFLAAHAQTKGAREVPKAPETRRPKPLTGSYVACWCGSAWPSSADVPEDHSCQYVSSKGPRP